MGQYVFGLSQLIKLIIFSSSRFIKKKKKNQHTNPAPPRAKQILPKIPLTPPTIHFYFYFLFHVIKHLSFNVV